MVREELHRAGRKRQQAKKRKTMNNAAEGEALRSRRGRKDCERAHEDMDKEMDGPRLFACLFLGAGVNNRALIREAWKII